jgi:hypothetical protein
MTLKQFGYLAGGAVVAYICYKLPLPVFFSLPLAVASGMLGFGLAFVPVEERPMDVWIMSFLKRIYSPTLYVWQREKPVPEKTLPVPAATVSTAQPAPKTAPTLTTLPADIPAAKPQPTVVAYQPPAFTQDKPAAIKIPVMQQPPASAAVETAVAPVSQPKPEPPNVTKFFTPSKPASTPQLQEKHTVGFTGSSFWTNLFGWFTAKPASIPATHIQTKPIQNQHVKPTLTTLPSVSVPATVTHRSSGIGFTDWLKNMFGVHLTPPKIPAELMPADKDVFADIKTPHVTGKTLNVPGFNAPAAAPVADKSAAVLPAEPAPTPKQADDLNTKNQA